MWNRGTIETRLLQKLSSHLLLFFLVCWNVTYGPASCESVFRASLLCASECEQMQLSGQSGHHRNQKQWFSWWLFVSLMFVFFVPSSLWVRFYVYLSRCGQSKIAKFRVYTHGLDISLVLCSQLPPNSCKYRDIPDSSPHRYPTHIVSHKPLPSHVYLWRYGQSKIAKFRVSNIVYTRTRHFTGFMFLTSTKLLWA